MKKKAILFAVLAAAFYAINVPFSKILLNSVAPTVMAALLYLGAGVGVLVYGGINRLCGGRKAGEPLTAKELPYTVAMVVLDIAAPVLLMLGISRTSSANVSLLNNFEIVATTVIALVIFRETVSGRLWLAIGLVTAASIILGFEGGGGISLDAGALLVLGACVCWGFENNCTRMMSSKSSMEIVAIKGCFSGLGSLVIAHAIGESLPSLHLVVLVMLLGFVSYGLSINFYILAQKDLGAAKTSAYYAIAPFLGVGFSLLVLGERPRMGFYIALILMAVSTVLMVRDTVALQHTHEHTHVHIHEHSHNGIVHTHEHAHVHTHTHIHAEDSADDHRHNHRPEEMLEHDHAHE